jgi:hypothetical protein
MKIKELIYQTPEITEEKLLEIINKNIPMMRKEARNRIQELHKGIDLAQAFLDEYDLIQDKKSYLTKGQRNQVIGFVGLCMIKMVKGNDGTAGERTTEQSISESTN